MSGFYKNLIVGDKVLIRKQWGLIVQRVEKLTKTMIVIDDGSRFRRDSGSEVGATAWSWKSLEEATDESIKEIKKVNRKRGLVKILKNVNYSNMTLEALEEIYKLVELKNV